LGEGTVFEIAKTAHGYASTPTTLVSFNGTDGSYPVGGILIANGHGDLLGTTSNGLGATGVTVRRVEYPEYNWNISHVHNSTPMCDARIGEIIVKLQKRYDLVVTD
jgi:hypothetical protein